jgi:hypothetical protein
MYGESSLLNSALFRRSDVIPERDTMRFRFRNSARTGFDSEITEFSLFRWSEVERTTERPTATAPDDRRTRTEIESLSGREPLKKEAAPRKPPLNQVEPAPMFQGQKHHPDRRHDGIEIDTKPINRSLKEEPMPPPPKQRSPSEDDPPPERKAKGTQAETELIGKPLRDAPPPPINKSGRSEFDTQPNAKPLRDAPPPINKSGGSEFDTKPNVKPLRDTPPPPINKSGRSGFDTKPNAKPLRDAPPPINKSGGSEFDTKPLKNESRQRHRQDRPPEETRPVKSEAPLPRPIHHQDGPPDESRPVKSEWPLPSQDEPLDRNVRSPEIEGTQPVKNQAALVISGRRPALAVHNVTPVPLLVDSHRPPRADGELKSELPPSPPNKQPLEIKPRQAKDAAEEEEEEEEEIGAITTLPFGDIHFDGSGDESSEEDSDDDDDEANEEEAEVSVNDILRLVEPARLLPRSLIETEFLMLFAIADHVVAQARNRILGIGD